MESMCPGVSTPWSISRLPRLARAIWPASAPTPTLLVCACTLSAAPFRLSRNPMGRPYAGEGRNRKRSGTESRLSVRVRLALEESAERRMSRQALRAEVERVNGDPADRAEKQAILALMEELAPTVDF